MDAGSIPAASIGHEPWNAGLVRLDIRFQVGAGEPAESYLARKVQARVNEALRRYELGLADGLDLWLPRYVRCGPVAA